MTDSSDEPQRVSTDPNALVLHRPAAAAVGVVAETKADPSSGAPPWPRKVVLELMQCAIAAAGPPKQSDALLSAMRDITALNDAKHALEGAVAQLERLVEKRTRELNTANERLRCEVDRTQVLENRLVAMLENEQRRIGQDLHDNIGSQLSGVEMLCEAMLRKGDKARAAHGVRTIARLLRNAMEDTRQIAHGMAPIPLCPQGLALSLKALARLTRTTTGRRCTMRNYGAEIADPAVALHLYRIAQEAISNAARHGDARRITIVLTNGVGVRLMIRDDGRGMTENPPGHFGLGITTMQIRARAIGGLLSVRRNAKGGTDVICSVPPSVRPPLPVHHP